MREREELAYLIDRDEELSGELSDLANVVVALLHTQARKAQCRLTTTAVLLGQVDVELVQDLAGVAAQRAEQAAVAVHDNEAELVISLEQLVQGL